MNKRGVFFTLSALLVVLSFFLIVAVTDKTTRIDKDIALDRAYELSNSVEKSILELFSGFSDVRINITRNPDGTSNATFIENISSREDPWGQNFAQVMNNFKTFVESQDSNVKINMTQINDKTLPITIMPHNIVYSRNWETGHVKIDVVPSQMNFGSYEVTVNAGDVNISNTNSHFGNNGTFLFQVISKDNYGHVFTDYQYVDPTDSHDVQIFFEGGNTATVSMTGGSLETWTNEANTLIIETKLDNMMKYDEKIKIKVFESMVNVSFPDIGVYKIKDVVVEQEY